MQPASVSLPGLAEVDREVVHKQAEAARVGHVSVGPAEDRTLVLWRKPTAEEVQTDSTAREGAPPRPRWLNVQFPAPEPAPSPPPTPGEPEEDVAAAAGGVRLNHRGREVVGNPVAVVELRPTGGGGPAGQVRLHASLAAALRAS